MEEMKVEVSDLYSQKKEEVLDREKVMAWSTRIAKL